DVAIAIPNGYFLSLGSLLWMRDINLEAKNTVSQQYREVFRRTLKAVDDCLQRGQDFDITIDNGRRIEGYKHLIKIRE
ncbi:MAG TPA: hypothetical protein VFB72_11580, partial [Verrucomicrobiae bacterium]|nr:hypothetical protein [Verrucomicrobiae bacterium]